MGELKTQKKDIPGIIAPPPLIFALMIGAGAALHYAWPLAAVAPGLRYVLAAPLFVGALILVALSLREFRRARTHVDPYRPATALLTSGPYRFTRNPLYVALGLVHAMIGFALNSTWILLFLIPAMTVIQYGVIRREERYLDRKFGDAYRVYQSRVRRWI